MTNANSESTNCAAWRNEHDERDGDIIGWCRSDQDTINCDYMPVATQYGYSVRGTLHMLDGCVRIKRKAPIRQV